MHLQEEKTSVIYIPNFQGHLFFKFSGTDYFLRDYFKMHSPKWKFLSCNSSFICRFSSVLIIFTF